MKWMMGLALLATAGCGGYRQTRMVACPDTGCGNQYAARSSPQGLPAPMETPQERAVYRSEPIPVPPAPPAAPIPPPQPAPIP